MDFAYSIKRNRWEEISQLNGATKTEYPLLFSRSLTLSLFCYMQIDESKRQQNDLLHVQKKLFLEAREM